MFYNTEIDINIEDLPATTFLSYYSDKTSHFEHDHCVHEIQIDELFFYGVGFIRYYILYSRVKLK